MDLVAKEQGELDAIVEFLPQQMSDEELRGIVREVIAEVGHRLSGIYEVFRSAAATDEDIRVQWQEIQAERLAGSRRFVEILAGKGALRAHLDPHQAGDVVWVHIDASLYHRFVVERGWSPTSFTDWFTRSLSDFLLEPGPELNLTP